MPLKEELKKRIPVLERQPVTIINGIDLTKNASDTNYDLNARRKQRDTSYINDYESLPDNNILTRIINPAARAEYDEKQAMVDHYNTAKERQITDALGNYDNQDVLATLANGNKLFDGGAYEQAVKDIVPYLSQNGITEGQMKDYFSTQKAQQNNQGFAQYAEEHPILATASAIPWNLKSGIETGITEVGNYLSGKPIGSNTAVNERAKAGNIMTGTAKDTLVGNAKTDAGKFLGSLAYDAASSTGDYISNLAMTGFNPVAALALMGYKSAAQSLNEQKGKDTTAAQKMGTAAINGAIEMLTEKIPMDNLFTLAKTPAGKNVIKQVLFGVGKQAAEEGVEEFVNEIASNIADWGINGGESDYANSVNAYMAQGMSEDQAKNQAKLDVVKNAGYAGAAGALSGGVMGGFASVGGTMGGRNGNLNPQIAENTQIPVLNSVNQQSTSEIPQTEQSIPSIADIAERVRRLENPDFVRTETQTETIADRVRRVESETPLKTKAQYIGDNPFVPSDMNLDEIIESNAQRNAPNIQAAQEQLAKPYNKSTVDGMKEYSSGMKDFINMFGNEDIKKSFYPQLVSLLNEYQQTGDPAKYNEAADLAAYIDKQMVGKTYKNKAGNSYDFIPDSFYDEFASGYNAFNKMYLDKKNAIPTLKNTEQQSNYDDALWDRDLANAANETASQEQQEIPVLNKKGKNSKKNAVMAEDIGLTYKEPTIRETDDGSIILEAEVERPKRKNGTSTTNAKKVGNNSNISRFATNSLQNNFDYMQNPVSQANLKTDIEAGVYNKGQNATNKVDVYHDTDVDADAQNYRENRREVLNSKQESGDLTDTAAYKATMMDAQEAEENGDHDRQRWLSTRLAGTATDAGRILRQLAREALTKAPRTGTNLLSKLNVLIADDIDTYFKNKFHAKEQQTCSDLSKNMYQLRNNGNVDSIKANIRAMLDSSGSKFKKFSDSDVDYLAKMIQNGMKTNDIDHKLRQKIVTGKIDVTDSDLDTVNKLMKEANNYNPNSKKAAELDTQACKILSEYLKGKDFSEKLRAWRYLAMLGNPRTHIRNLTGNFLFGQIMENISDKVAAAIEVPTEKIASLAGKDFERTKTLKIASPEMKEAAGKYLDENAYAKLTDDQEKWADMKRGIKSEQNTFKFKPMQKLLDANSGALEWGDTIFLTTKYKQAMSNYLLANGKNVDIFKSTDAADKAMLEKASDYAIRKAKEATFHEKNAFAEWWKKARPKNKVGGMITDALLPFVKTPANVMKESVSYTPLGIADAATQVLKYNDPTVAIEKLAKSLTGSGLMMLGMYLKAMGAIRTKGDKDEKQLDKMTGKQDYSIEIGDKSVTMDWASPFMIPVFLGSELYQQFVEKDGRDVGQILSAVLDPVTEMSMLQGINDTLESISNYQQDESSGLGKLVVDSGANFVMQHVPTLFGQVARSIDDTRRNTYYTGKEGTADTVGKYGKQFANKIPVLTQTNQPQLNAWGDEQKNRGNDFFERYFYNGIFPGYVSDIKQDTTTQELYRLNEATNGGAKNALPSLAKSKPDTNMESKLTPEQYTNWQTISGKNEKKFDDAAINSEYYKSLSDADKVDLLNDVQGFSNALSKYQDKDINYNIETNDTYKKKYQAYEYDKENGLINYIRISNAISDKVKNDDRKAANNEDKFSVIDSMEGLSEKDKIFYLKQRIDYSDKAKYLDSINEKYAYDWYMLNTKYGTKKDDINYGLLRSDLPEDEKAELKKVVDMKTDDVKYYLMKKGIK